MTLIKKKIIFPYSKPNICSYIEQINTRPKVLNYCSWGKTDVTKKGLEFLDQTFRVHGSTSLLKTAEGTYLSCVPKWTVTASQWARLDQQKLRLWWWEKKNLGSTGSLGQRGGYRQTLKHSAALHSHLFHSNKLPPPQMGSQHPEREHRLSNFSAWLFFC